MTRRLIQSAALDRQAAELARAEGITETQARRKLIAGRMILEMGR